MGGFYGFKLHWILNDTGDLLDGALTAGNTDDRRRLWELNPDGQFHGSLYADRGYISKDLREHLPRTSPGARGNPRLQSPKEHASPGRIRLR